MAPTKIDLGPSIEIYNRTIRVRYDTVPEMMTAHSDTTNWGPCFAQFWRTGRTLFIKSRDTRLGDVASVQEDSDIQSLSDCEFPILFEPD